MQPTSSRLAVGFAILGAAILTRLVGTPGGAVMSLGPHLPMLTRLDLVTGPMAVLGIAVLAAAHGLGRLRRTAGVLALVAAAGWPAVKFGTMSPVLFSLSATHGVHVHDLLAFPVLGSALALLAPWRTAFRFGPEPIGRRMAPAALRTVAQH